MDRLKLKQNNIDKTTNTSLWVCQCGWEKCKPVHTVGPATRDHYIIHYIKKGKGIFINSHGKYHLKKGDGFLINPTEIVNYIADKDDPWEYVWVGFKGVDAEHLAKLCNLTAQEPTFTLEPDTDIVDVFRKMFQTYKTQAAREYENIGYLYIIFSRLIANNTKLNNPTSNSDLYLKSAVEYINNNYSYNVNVTKLAAHIGIDRTYLYRIFMDHLSISPEQYLLKVRMTKAANLLKTTDLTVLEVALSTGFKDISHFSSYFKKVFELSPTKYRKAQAPI